MKIKKYIRFVLITVIFLESLTFFSGISNAEQNLRVQKEVVVLIHGFFRTERDMSFLKNYFQSRGYGVITPRLPTTFGSLEKCTEDFERMFGEIQGNYNRIHFVGHSMGGLVLRLFLSRNRVSRIGRCVLIGTPNRGSKLAGFFDWWPVTGIVKPLRAFRPGGVDIPSPLNSPPPEMGAIAGNRRGILIGKFIEGENDGHVPVDSVPFDGMKELAILPYHHNEIHHKSETAELLYKFLQEGSFGNLKK